MQDKAQAHEEGWGWVSSQTSTANPEGGMQGAIKEGTRVANPTACAAFHPIHQSPLSQFPRSARARKNEGGHVATKHKGRPLALQKTQAFLQGACLHLLQINSDNKQCQRSRIHGEGPLGPDAEIHQGKLREAAGRRTRVASPAGFPACSSSVQQPHPPI